MKLNELAYSTQQHLQTSTGIEFKRSHIYELMAAAFGFNSYAALNNGSVFTEHYSMNAPMSPSTAAIHSRCAELGYQLGIFDTISLVLVEILLERRIGVVGIAEIVAELHGESDMNKDAQFDLNSSLLFDGLERAANNGHALAHYALSLHYSTYEDEDSMNQSGSEYWYLEAQRGRVLAGVEKEWADAYATKLTNTTKYAHHLREAAKLGQQDALLELADWFDDATFFDRNNFETKEDPARIAEIAMRLGRTTDARKWLSLAAESGDTDAMRQLIEDDQVNLQLSWTWIYLAKLVGNDLTKNDYVAIHEDGSLYDDDVGGAMFVDGRDGVNLEPLSESQDAVARFEALEMFKRIQQQD